MLDDVPSPTPTTLPLADCAGLVLTEDVAAKLPVPPFTNSAMDGFAVRAADLVAEGAQVARMARAPRTMPQA